MTQPRILMCRPSYFGIEYEINPWMNVHSGADAVLAVQQWEGLRRLLVDAGAAIEEITPIAGLPDLVFTANAGLVFREPRDRFAFSARSATGRGATPAKLVSPPRLHD
ncbi:MAG: hypothetical protein R3C10_26500 [Pirellulales bacterium]